MNDIFKRNKRKLYLSLLAGVVLTGNAQEGVSLEELSPVADTIRIETPTDTLFVAPSDSITKRVLLEADSLVIPIPEELAEAKTFKPNPTRAVLYSLVPGLGQVYNRKYWKLPILYGGLLGCFYAITWNDKNYADYSQAYWAVSQKDPVKHLDDWIYFVQGTIDRDDTDALIAKAQDSNFQTQLKRRKDYFRRYRDMSIFIAAGVYILGILDAYVDAHLFDFDISPDLSMRVEPTIVPGNSYTPQIYGINCSIKF